MTKIGIVALLGAFAVGCGGGDESSSGGGAGSPPDFGAIEGRLTQPSGTFAPGQENAAMDGFGTQSAATEQNPLGGSSGSTAGKSAGELSIQTVSPLADPQCQQLQNGGKGTCACPGGGSIAYDVPANAGQTSSNGAIDQTISVQANNCVSGDQTVNGSIYMKIKNPPPMQLFSIHIAITGRDAGKYDVDYMYKDGMITFAVDVADGRVLVSAKGSWDSKTKTGTLVIRDKSETWTCEMTNGKGQCTSSGGTVRKVGS